MTQNIFSMFSEWAAITTVEHIPGEKNPYCETHYYFMNERVKANWKPRNWRDQDLTTSRLSPIQTRALCESDVHDIPRLIQEADERILFYKTERPMDDSERKIQQQTLNVWQLRQEYLKGKYSLAILAIWPEMKRRRAMLARALHPRVVALCGLGRLDSALLERIVILSEA